MPDNRPAEISAGRYTIAGPGVIMKDFGEETVVANLYTGLFYSLGGSAIELWSWLSEGRTTAEIAAAFPGESAAVEEFLARLVAEALLKPADTLPAPLPPLTLQAFTPPAMESFDDLQGLLLVDPIHDVSDQGWPIRQTQAS
jgi:hypothetical protein